MNMTYPQIPAGLTDPSAEIPDELDLVLRKPITVGNTEVSVLHLTEPTLKQLREASKESTHLGQLCKLVELNAKVLPMVVDAMLQRDMDAAASFFGRFNRGSLPTTAT